MKQILSDIAAVIVIAVFLWVSYWVAAVIETGVPMPEYIFCIMVGIYACLAAGLIGVMAFGIHKLIRRRTRRSRCLGMICMDQYGNYYIKK